MKTVEKITVNGEVYTISDPGAVKLDNSEIGETGWSSKETIDRLCPSFREVGQLVTCLPVAGYPLEITADSATTVTRCGKNLLGLQWQALGADDLKRLPLQLPPGTYTAFAEKKAGETGECYFYIQSSTDGGITWKDSCKLIVNNKVEAKTFIVTGAEGEQWAVHCPHKRYVELVERVQVQWGSQATEYAAPRIEQFSVGETISALPGVNHIFADAGEVTVTGKADPSALIHQLTDAILSLGGNV